MRLARPCGQRCPPFLPPCPGPPGSWSGCWGGPCVGGWAAETRISCPGASSGSDTQPLRECRRHPAGEARAPRDEGRGLFCPFILGPSPAARPSLPSRQPPQGATPRRGPSPTAQPARPSQPPAQLQPRLPVASPPCCGFLGGLRTPQNLVHRMRGVPGTVLPRKRHDGSEPRPNVRVSGDSRLRVLLQGCLRGAHGLRPSPQQEAGLPPS